jgi:hypothetical protein
VDGDARCLRLCGDGRRARVLRVALRRVRARPAIAGNGISPSGDERASTSALRDEILLAERAAHAARELLSGGDTAQVLARLCRTTTRLLACDASYTFVRDADDAKAFVAVASDGDGGSEWVSRRALRIPDIVLTGLLDRLDSDEPVVLGGGATFFPSTARCACIPRSSPVVR